MRTIKRVTSLSFTAITTFWGLVKKASKYLPTRFAHWLLTWFESYCLRKYYTSIKELPIVRFAEIYDTESYEPLLKHGKIDRFAQIAYEKLESDLVDIFGVSQEFKTIINKRIVIELMYLKQVETGDTSNQLLIDVEESELAALRKSQGKSDIYMAIASLASKGFVIDPEKLTVFQFYKYTKYLTQGYGNK